MLLCRHCSLRRLHVPTSSVVGWAQKDISHVCLARGRGQWLRQGVAHYTRLRTKSDGTDRYCCLASADSARSGMSERSTRGVECSRCRAVPKVSWFV